MAKANRECHTCSTKYYYCPTCPDDKRNPRIYVMWCGERCAKIFNLLSAETFNNITTEECKEELLKLNITEKDNLKDSIKKHIQRVMDSASSVDVIDTADVVETTNVVEEPVVEETKIEESVEASEIIEVDAPVTGLVENVVEPTEVVEEVVDAESIETISEVTDTDNNYRYKKRNKKYRNSEVN